VKGVSESVGDDCLMVTDMVSREGRYYEDQASPFGAHLRLITKVLSIRWRVTIPVRSRFPPSASGTFSGVSPVNSFERKPQKLDSLTEGRRG
jgi:hypothetical protein